MKERVYGWYPSANDIYSNRGPHNKYQQECLYKFRNTMYESKQVVPPSPNLMVRGYSPAPPSISRPTSATDTRPAKHTIGPSRPKTAPVPKFKLIPRLKIPTPSQCWSTNVAETEYNVSGPTHQTGSRPSTASTQISWPVPKGLKPEVAETTQKLSTQHSNRSQISWPRPNIGSQAPEPEEQTHRRERIKSASIRREKTPVPKRPIKSAGPVRTPIPGTDVHVPEVQSPAPEVETEPEVPPPNPVHVYRADAEAKEEEEEEGLPWEEAREKYGWMAEVHGNPYGYKKIPKRPCYTFKCKEPEVAPEAPPVHMENMETFFYNTIPRRPMTFTVHKEWISEVLHAKRLELQKRIGVNYRWKNFGFVY